MLDVGRMLRQGPNVPADVLRRYVVPEPESAFDPQSHHSSVQLANRATLEAKGIRFDDQGQVMVPAENVFAGKTLTFSEDELIKVLLINGADDPLDAFRAGTKGQDGLTLAQVGRLLNEGAHSYKQALERCVAPSDYGSLKTDAFAYGIEAQSDAGRVQRAERVAQMLDGDLGYKYDLGQAQAGENLNRKLPVVFDRQAYKVAAGFSMNPGTWIRNRSGYNPFAHAYRIVAAEVGVVCCPWAPDDRPVRLARGGGGDVCGCGRLAARAPRAQQI